MDQALDRSSGLGDEVLYAARVTPTIGNAEMRAFLKEMLEHRALHREDTTLDSIFPTDLEMDATLSTKIRYRIGRIIKWLRTSDTSVIFLVLLGTIGALFATLISVTVDIMNQGVYFHHPVISSQPAPTFCMPSAICGWDTSTGLHT